MNVRDRFPEDDSAERRLSRFLDGDLDEEERCAFDEDLTKGSEQLRDLAECSEIDRLARGALRDALAPAWDCGTGRRPSSARPTVTRSRRAWLCAAILLLTVMGAWLLLRVSRNTSVDQPEALVVEVEPRREIVRVGASSALRPESGRMDGEQAGDFVRPVSTSSGFERSRGQRLIQSHLFSFLDEKTDDLYLFELQRIKTTVEPLRLDL